MLEEMVQRRQEYDILYVLNTESIPETILDIFAWKQRMSSKMYVKSDRIKEFAADLCPYVSEGVVDAQTLKLLSENGTERPKVSLLRSGVRYADNLQLAEIHSYLLRYLAQQYGICVIADPSIQTFDQGVKPHEIDGFNEYGMLWYETKNKLRLTMPQDYDRIPLPEKIEPLPFHPAGKPLS